MILIIGAWIYLFLLNLSIGAGLLKWISRFAGNSLTLRFNLFYKFWFGFVILIGILQIISLFLPINKTSFLVVSLIGLFFAVINYKSVFFHVKSFLKWLITPRGIISFIVVLILLVLVSYSANRETLHGDTFIYHYNAVKWAKSYPAVPGLANLHSRFGFNSSFFLFAALTERGVFNGESAHIALSFLMAVAIIQWFFIIADPKESMTKRIFCMLTSLFLLSHIISQIDITSLSTDYPMSILALVFCVILLDKTEHKLLLLLPIAAVVFAFKLSGMLAVLAALVVLLGTIFLTKYSNKDRALKKSFNRINLVSFGLLCVIVAGFVTRNAIVSGWLLFPFPIGNLHLPWSVPEAEVINTMEWIKSYPRVPGGASPTTIAGNTFFWWFTQWNPAFRQSLEFGLLLGAISVLLWALFQVPSFGKFIYAKLNIVLIILFAIASIWVWFSAPDPRFGSVYFFIFFASAVALLYEGSRYKTILKMVIPGIFIFQVVNKSSSYIIDREPQLFTFPITKQPALKTAVASADGENPILYTYMPMVGDACGDSPLPCTPYIFGGVIRQRVPGDMSKGFMPLKPGKKE